MKWLLADTEKFKFCNNVENEVCTCSRKSETSYRVHTGPGKPGKSWDFIIAFSRTGKSWKGHWSWKVLEIC